LCSRSFAKHEDSGATDIKWQEGERGKKRDKQTQISNEINVMISSSN
jgi:hypothetical protein